MASHWLVMLAIMLGGGMLFYAFVCWMIRRGLRDAARAFYDPDFRDARIAELGEKLAGENPGVLRERAQLYYYAGKMAEAAADARAYAAQNPSDAEGWAELAEYELASGRAEAARDAARAAETGLTAAAGRENARARRRDDYLALRLRACLYMNDLENAGAALAEWEKSDAERVAQTPAPHRWSWLAQMPQAEIRPDPAVKFYRAVYCARAGKDAEAAALARELRQEVPDFLDAINRTRCLAVLTPEAIPGAESVPAEAGETLEKALAAAEARRVYAVSCRLTASGDAARAVAEAFAAWQDAHFFPHLAFIVCTDAPTREALSPAASENGVYQEK